MLLLQEPRGFRYHNNSAHISIRGPRLSRYSDECMLELLMGYGCPRSSGERAVSCLIHSGRYDCVVATGWLDGLSRDLAEYGYELITSEPG